MSPDSLADAREFLHSLNQYGRTLELINDRIGPELLAVMQGFVDQALAGEDPTVRQRMVGFLVIGFLLRSHMERRELDARTRTDGE